MPPVRPSAWARRISAMAPSRSSRIGSDDQTRPAGPGSRLAQLRGPPVVRAGAGEQVLRAVGDDRVEAGAERRAHGAGHRVGAGEHDLGGHPVAVELAVARRGVPTTAQADLVEAVALVVLAEPLLLELGVADEVAASRPRRFVDEPLALGELVVELGPERRVEELAVRGRVRPGVAVGRDDEVGLHETPRCSVAVSLPRSGVRSDVRRGVVAERHARRALGNGVEPARHLVDASGPNRAARGVQRATSKP